ncbi:MAG TPA: hypothetical protein VIJ94_17770 [Caulobacteraceae bacterium]
MIRFLLALFAILGLLISPAAACAAGSACDHEQSAAMAGMSMPGVGHAAPNVAAADPCCDQSHHQMSGKSCAMACATTCGVAVALPPTPSSVLLVAVPATTAEAPVAPLHTFRPSGLERPPKSMV